MVANYIVAMTTVNYQATLKQDTILSEALRGGTMKLASDVLPITWQATLIQSTAQG